MASKKIARASMNSTVFFQCDVQTRFKDLIYKMPHVIHTSKLMANTARVMNIPLIVTEQYKKVLGSTFEEIQACYPEDVIIKEKFCFSMLSDEVNDHFESIDKKQVVLYGIEGHVCVQQTCLDLLERGYEVFLLTDGISSSRALDRSTALQRMRDSGATLTTSESIIFELLKASTAPLFKPMSPYIKDPRPEDQLDSL